MSEGPSVARGRPVTSRLTRAGTPAAYAAAVLAFAYAAVSLYWTMGGRLLLETVGGTAVEVARGGGMPAVLLGLTATVLKVVAGLLALVLVRPWGRAVPRRWLLICLAAASAVLTGSGGLIVAAGALALSGTVHTGGADLRALRWHVAVWDMWFLLWGLLLATGTVAHWRQTRAIAWLRRP